MIVYNDVFELLKKNGWSTYRLIKERKIGDGTIRRIKAGQSISTDTVDKICNLCKCQPGDILTHTPDKPEG